MGDDGTLQFEDGARFTTRSASHPEIRPLPLRTTSEPETCESSPDSYGAEAHVRRKSTYTFQDGSTSYLTRRPNAGKYTPQVKTRRSAKVENSSLSPVAEQQSAEIHGQAKQLSPTISQVLTPPITPVKRDAASPSSQSGIEVTSFDFSQIDYELDRARRTGSGLWSSVYLADPIIKSPTQPHFTPPTTPQGKLATSITRIFAVKTPIRPDAKKVFSQEAKILTRLQQSQNAPQHIVSFHGLDARNSCLVFEGVIGGSLEDLTSRLKVMAELARHLELRALFPGLANDLICALRFVHDSGIVHADIKPANVVLDVTDERGLHQPVLRARYIDFSASFVAGEDSAANAGGTWDFMAPEQLRRGIGLIPTYASDVWSLGITLLTIIVGGSPYTAACGDNLFMLREAIKSGDPLGFARMDPTVQKRLSACQDFVDCCRLVLQKEPDRRYTAAAWESWLEKQ